MKGGFMKRKVLIGMLAVVLLAGLLSCAGLQAKWSALTPDEKARIVINDLQGQLDNAFTQGKAYIAVTPTAQAQWRTQIVPAFDVANKALASIILIGKTKPLTPEFVYAQAQAQVTNVLNLLIQLKAIK
jgi:hypothetical protein